MVFDEASINQYSRRQAFEGKDQYVKQVNHQQLKTTTGCIDRTDVFNLKSIPAKHQLVKWSSELSKMNRLAVGNHYFECDSGNVNYIDVKNLLSLHNILEIKRAVSQEISWFNSHKLAPKNISLLPNKINKFKNMIMESPSLFGYSVERNESQYYGTIML